MRCFHPVSVLAAALAALRVAAAVPPSLARVSEVTRQTADGAIEASGITWAGGNLYYVVDDKDHRLYPVTIELDETGAISSHAVGAGVSVRGAKDMEGCAWDPGAGTVWVADETDASIREIDPATGDSRRSAPVPGVFRRHVPNYSLEALSLSPDGLSLWTANEEALPCDGSRSTKDAGSLVRLVKFTRSTVRGDWTPAGQWAYLTEPVGTAPVAIGGDIKTRSGVSGLCALPDGSLLVLERALSGRNLLLCRFHARVFRVDVGGSADVSAMPSLAGCPPVAKELLYDSGPIWGNYEGICLGPQRPDGSLAVLLIADAGGAGTAGPRPGTLSLALSGFAVRTMYFADCCCGGPVGGPYRFCVEDADPRAP